jgi:hypothetical protein
MSLVISDEILENRGLSEFARVKLVLCTGTAKL